MPSVSNLQEEGAGTGLAWMGGGGWGCAWPPPQEGQSDREQERRCGAAGLPGSVADERLGEVPGEIVGSELRQGHHTGPCLFRRGPWGDERAWEGHNEGLGPRAPGKGAMKEVEAENGRGHRGRRPVESKWEPLSPVPLCAWAGQSSGAPWWREGGSGRRLTEESEDEVQLLLDRGAGEEGPPRGHLVVDAAHAPAGSNGQDRRQAGPPRTRLS